MRASQQARVKNGGGISTAAILVLTMKSQRVVRSDRRTVCLCISTQNMGRLIIGVQSQHRGESLTFFNLKALYLGSVEERQQLTCKFRSEPAAEICIGNAIVAFGTADTVIVVVYGVGTTYRADSPCIITVNEFAVEHFGCEGIEPIAKISDALLTGADSGCKRIGIKLECHKVGSGIETTDIVHNILRGFGEEYHTLALLYELLADERRDNAAKIIAFHFEGHFCVGKLLHESCEN